MADKNQYPKLYWDSSVNQEGRFYRVKELNIFGDGVDLTQFLPFTHQAAEMVAMLYPSINKEEMEMACRGWDSFLPYRNEPYFYWSSEFSTWR